MEVFRNSGIELGLSSLRAWREKVYPESAEVWVRRESLRERRRMRNNGQICRTCIFQRMRSAFVLVENDETGDKNDMEQMVGGDASALQHHKVPRR